MKFISSLVMMAFSTISLAAPSQWVFHGSGEYRNNLGEVAGYSVTTNKTQTAENTYLVVKNVVAESGESMTFSIKIVKNDLGMIAVQNLDGEDIGSGYYFKDHSKKMMHIEFNTPEGSVEKTIVSDLDGYKEIGSSYKAEDQSKGMWLEYGYRIFPGQ